MLNHVVNRFIDRQRWLEPVADFLQKIVAGSYKFLGNPGRALKNVRAWHLAWPSTPSRSHRHSDWGLDDRGPQVGGHLAT